jgi:ABC-type bacteriocin/lantibiotic exporter with double-glycine peptidase domain
MCTPIVTRAVIGHALPNRASGELRLLAALVAVLGVAGAYVGWLRRRALLYFSTKLSEIASIDVLGHVLRLPYSQLTSVDVSGGGQAVRSAISAAEAIPTLVPQVADAVLGIALLGYVFMLNAGSAAIAGVGATFTILLGLFNAKKRLGMRRELQRRTRRETQALYETLAGVETVKAESIEGRMLVRWLDRLLLEEKMAQDLRIGAATLSAVLTVVDRTVFGAILLLTAHRCITTGADVADLVATVQAATGFMQSAQKLAQLPLAIVNFRSDLERADAMLVEVTEKDRGGRRPANPQAPALVLRDVWFRYDDDSPWVLTGMDLVVHAGEAVMLSWPSGAGKSTVLRILAGLLPPARGDALVFGIEATQARRMISYIPQQATLFSGSLMENLRILSGASRPERILEAARATGLLELAATWPMGLDTILTLDATNVSSGQRQLILYTAAVASETPIVLLDEALAHVDLGLRARLGAADLFKGRTVISVVHDANPREVSHARRVAPAGVGG